MVKSRDHHDQDHSSRSSSTVDQEVDQPVDYVAAVRFYECMFCKRGFTTAQALGGHMNIHRKERPKNRQTHLIHSNNHHHPQLNNRHRTSPNKIYGPPLPGNYNPSAAEEAHEGQKLGSYQTYFPASTSSGVGLLGYGIGTCERNPQLGDDWRMSLSLRIGGAEGEEEGKGVERGGGGDIDEEEDELDLELRLGYNR